MKFCQLPLAVTKSKKSFLPWRPGGHEDQRGTRPSAGGNLSQEADIRAQLVSQAACVPCSTQGRGKAVALSDFFLFQPTHPTCLRV